MAVAWWIYNVLFSIAYLLMLPRFFYRMWRRGGYRRGFLERLGLYAPAVADRLKAGGGRIWVHGVSVGEIYVALRFMEELRKRDPSVSYVLTTTTSTGHRVAEQHIGAQDVLLYFPCDFPFVIRRVLDRLRPRALMLTESELWPNLVRLTHGRRIPIVLVNGRISESSYRGYGLIRAFFRRTLECLDLFLVQTAQDRDRLLRLGADPQRIAVMGSAKYDIVQADAGGGERARSVLAAVGAAPTDPVMVGGSTWPGEEGALLRAYARLKGAFPGLKLVLVPRHAERGAEVAAEIGREGLVHIKRSDVQVPPRTAEGSRTPPADVLLVDTTGELRDFYACADVIFVGKSLKARGGQNIIEPAMLGKPVVVGPHMENFPAVAADFRAAKALCEVRDENELEGVLRSLLSDESRRAEVGRRAAEVVRAQSGAVRESTERIARLFGIEDRSPSGE